ncbi:MAG: hypothetical protein JWQ95_41, partial [Sphaerisporangium sp.]|nr:hypothetical protein [Sphaerisporangium sp.]
MLSSWRGWIKVAGMLAVVVPATLISPMAAQAIDDPGWHKAQAQQPVPGHDVKARAPLADPGAKYDLKGAPPVAWPQPGTAVVKMAEVGAGATASAPNAQSGTGTRAEAGGKVRAGQLPVWLGPASAATSAAQKSDDKSSAKQQGTAAATPAPSGAASAPLPAVQVRTLDARAAE